MKVLAISNTFRVVNNDCQHTKILTFKNDINAFGFDYETNPSFEQQVRIGVRNFMPRYQTKEKVYRQTDGVFKRGNVWVDKVTQAESDYLDEVNHSALSTALKHSTLKMDFKAYFCEGEYEVDVNEDSGEILGLAQAKFKLIEQGYNRTNYSC